MATPKISAEFKTQTQFFVKVKGKIIKVPRAKFQKEAEKYINLGCGGYFDIPQKEAVSRAKAHTVAEKKAAQKAAQDIEAAQKSNEQKDAALLKFDGELKKLNGDLSATKKLADDQQKANANLVLEKDKLAASEKAAKAAAAKAQKEKAELAKQIAQMKKEMEASKKT